MTFFVPLTPLERLIDDQLTAWRIRQWYELNDWGIAEKARIHEQANSAHRSVGQLYRHAARRVRASLKEEQRK